jgi:transposase-like protein
MATREPTSHSTYRCPVCGHRDAAEVGSEAQAQRFPCSYCGSDLQVSARDREAVHLSVRLADRSMTH